MYQLTKEEHKKLLRNAITLKYNKTNAKIKDKIAKMEKENLKNKEVFNQ